VPALDVELLVDRLRFTGLDPDLVNEAERRLRTDQDAGVRRVEEQLRALGRPRRTPSCD
jgi:hypothetical protein